MKLSVVILNYNVRFFLEQCILSVERDLNGIEGEIIVIDNNSQDDSCEMVRKQFPHLTLIENKENVGFSKANNQAVAVAKGEYVCILNPDTAIAEGTFAKTLEFADATPHMGGLGIYLMDGTGNYLPESKRNLPTPRRSLMKLLGQTRGRNGYYALHVDKEDSGTVDVLVGAFMLIKRSVYNEVGGFDEDYFMYGEDIDLSYKLQKAGYENYYVGSISMLHYKGESTKKDGAYLDRFYGAMRIFYRKHFRSNVILNLMVNFGVAVAKLFRRRKEKKRRVFHSKAKEVLVFTESIPLLNKLSSHFDLPVKSAAKSMLQNPFFSNSLCIFDADYVSYAEIFHLMQLGKNKGNRFRIKPPGCNFVIGSDRSDEKGGVTEL
ncbi:MAG: glycosyltransferase family 2 protein [Bacteroidota bacterium]